MRWILLFLLYFGSCSPKAKKAEPQQNQKQEDLSAVYFCRGNEPFWMVKIDKEGMTFQTPEEAPLRYPVVASTITGSVLVFEGNLKNSTGSSFLKVTIEKQPCSDGMSDEEYAYTARVEKDEKSYVGCAEKQ